jgi:hypothetical protein
MGKFIPQDTLDAAGTYGDGSFGHQYTRDRCADTLSHYIAENFTARRAPVPPQGSLHPEMLVALLRGEMSDDASEEDEACEWLNTHAPWTGASWGWQDGDFGLWIDDSEED